MNIRNCFTSLAIACAVVPTPCRAHIRQIGPDRYAMAVRQADRPAPTRAAARQWLARIDQAALAVCGLSSFSLREVRLAMRRSPCWRDAMAGAVAQADDRLLHDAYRQRMGH